MILLYLSSSMKLTSEIYRDQLRMMDNLGRWIWMVIISIHLVIRGRNVSRAMITKAATIVMAQKEKTRKKLWMRYLLSYLLIIKADDVTPSFSVFCLLFFFFFFIPWIYIKKDNGKFEFKSSTTRTRFLIERYSSFSRVILISVSPWWIY